MAVDNDAIRVLHVDDEPGFATLTAEFLEREDDRFDVDPHTDPKAVPPVLEKRAYDCVVSDYEMPECDGLELLEAVRAERPNLPFFLFTGKGEDEIAKRAIDAGVTDYLHKNTGTEQYTILANRIVHAVERYRATHREPVHRRAVNTLTKRMRLNEPVGTLFSDD